MEILLVPRWMGDLHWAAFGILFWSLALWSWQLFRHVGNLRSMLHGIIWTSAGVICACFWLIQSEVLPVAPVYLFAIERAAWWPLGFAALVLVDVHAAELNGHRSMISRLDKYLQRERQNGHFQQ